MSHCIHCPGPEDPRHDDPEFAANEAACAFYENPENLIAAGPPRKRQAPAMISFRYEPPSCGPQSFTAGSRVRVFMATAG